MGDGAQQSVGDPCCGSVASVQLGVPGPRRSRCEPAYRCVAQGREDVAVEQVAVLGQRRLSEPSVLGRPLLGVVSQQYLAGPRIDPCATGLVHLRRC